MFPAAPPTISIIIPSYNRADLLKRAIQSVFKQTYKDWELIIIDDASTDHTDQIIVPLLDNQRIRCKRLEHNQGGAGARNAGIKMADGEYIAFLDSDDQWNPEKLRLQVQVLSTGASDVGLVYANIEKPGQHRHHLQKKYQGDVAREILIRNFVGTTSGPLIRKTTLLQVGLFDTNLPSCQDWDLWIRLARNCQFEYIDKKLTTVHQQPDSISSQRRSTVEGHRRLRKKHHGWIKNLDARGLAEHYFNLAIVYWWKKAVGNSFACTLQAVARNPAIIPQVVDFFLLRNLRKLTKNINFGNNRLFEKQLHTSHKSGPRILLLIEHLRVGGAERVVVDLAMNLKSHNIESVVVVYRDKGPLFDNLQQAGYRVIFLQKEWLQHFFVNRLQYLRPLLVIVESIVFVPRLAALARKEKIDLIHSHMFSANLWGRLAVALCPGKTKIIATEHTNRIKDASKKRCIINRILLRSCDRVVVVTPEVAKNMGKVYGVAAGHISIIPNGVDLEVFCQAHRELPVDSNPQWFKSGPRVLAIGRLVGVKRYDVLLAAARRLVSQCHEISIWILGEGSQRSLLESLIKRYDLTDSVFLIGQRSDVPHWLSLVDVVVNTSEREGLPISLLEAMAAAKPVIATAVGGNIDLITNNMNGYLVPPGDEAALAATIMKLLQNKVKAEEMGQNGRMLIAKNYSIEKVTRKWQRLYRELWPGK